MKSFALRTSVTLLLIFSSMIFPVVGPPRATAISPPAATEQAGIKFKRLPLRFELNAGQTDPEVLFTSRGRDGTVFLAQGEAVISLPMADGGSRMEKPVVASKHPDDLPSEIRNLRPAALRMKFVGANLDARVMGLEELPGKTNYFLGDDPSQWRTNVPGYAKVKYEDIYSGIDLIYYGNQGHPEYDFTVAPGADPDAIVLSYEGADKAEVDTAGDLVLHLANEEIHQHKPTVYQEVDGKRVEVAGEFKVFNPQSAIRNPQLIIGFQLGDYDADKPLIIDPMLVYSTYLGGSDWDAANGIDVDAAGNVYLTGFTASTDFPTANPFQPRFGGPNLDAFVVKLNATGSALIYATYLGGSARDNGRGVTVDAEGNAYVVGFAVSTNFPTTPRSFQPVFGGGFDDVFVAKLNPSGSALIYSTYLGGNDEDAGRGIAVDAAGNVYVAGRTKSTNFPLMNPIQSAAGGDNDAYVVKLNPSGSALIYSTYLGGSGLDEARSLAVDSAGNAYVTGVTGSSNFPRANSFQSRFGGGNTDAFVAKLNPSGSTFIYSTYLGGRGDDSGDGITADADGNAYVTGTTASNNFPTASPLQPGFGGVSDAFVTKFNAAGSALLYLTYLGSRGLDAGRSIALDAEGNAYVTGATASSDFPRANPLQATFGGVSDAFVTKLNPTGSALVYSTYLGGSGDENSTEIFDRFSGGIVVDEAGNAYVTGGTASSNFPKVNPLQPVYGGGRGDAFVVKIADAP